jgi:hypothetical protein
MIERSPIYDLLVIDSTDIESLVSYALYKKHKREWAKSFSERYSRFPSDADKTSFFEVVSTDDQLARYRKDAQDILVGFANVFVHDATPEIIQDALSDRIEKTCQEIEQKGVVIQRLILSQGSLWSQVKINAFATGLTIIVLLALTSAAALFGVDPVVGFKRLLGIP